MIADVNELINVIKKNPIDSDIGYKQEKDLTWNMKPRYLDDSWCDVTSLSYNNAVSVPPITREKLNCGLSPFIHGVDKEFSAFNTNASYVINITFAQDDYLDSILQSLTYEFLDYVGFNIEDELIGYPVGYQTWDRVNKRLEVMVGNTFPDKHSLYRWIDSLTNYTYKEPPEEECILDKCDDKESVSQEFLSLIS